MQTQSLCYFHIDFEPCHNFSMFSQYIHHFTVPAITDCSQTADNTAAVTGGVVVAVVFIVSITAAATVLVIVVLVLRNRRGYYSTGAQKK